MRGKLIAIALLVSLSGLLWWQVQQNGALAAVNEQYQAAIADMNTAMNDLAERNLKTNSLLADTRRQFQKTQQQAWGLADDLKKQSAVCVNAVIAESVVNRVRQFTDDQNTN